MRPIVTSIAGSDPCAGAGIQADLKAIEAAGGYGTTVITAITVQTAGGVRRSEALACDLVGEQLEVLLGELDVAALKSGMLAGAPTILRVASILREHRPLHYVLDPVLRAGDGFSLLPDTCIDLLRRELFPLSSLLTPNVHEAEILTGSRIRSTQDARAAGAELLEQGARAVLIKGGHLPSEQATDVLVTAEGTLEFSAERVEDVDAHGTGCVYASAIATYCARGRALPDAIRAAKRLVTQSIRSGVTAGGRRNADPLYRLHRRPAGAPR